MLSNVTLPLARTVQSVPARAMPALDSAKAAAASVIEALPKVMRSSAFVMANPIGELRDREQRHSGAYRIFLVSFIDLSKISMSLPKRAFDAVWQARLARGPEAEPAAVVRPHCNAFATTRGDLMSLPRRTREGIR